MKAKPLVVTVGSIKLPIYHTPHGDRDRFTLSWYEAGARKRKVFDHLTDAKREANDIGAKLASGRAAVLDLTAADRDSYVTAMRELPEGTPLHDAVRQYAAAVKCLPVGVSLLEAVKGFALRAAPMKGAKVHDLAEAFIARCEADCKNEKLSLRYVQSLRSHLRRFAQRFQVEIGSVKANEIKDWIRDTADSPKSANNLRGSVITFFRHAKENGFLSADIPTEAERTKRKPKTDSDIGILTPKQMQDLLAAGNEEARLYLALGGFAGLRTAELIRLEWSHVDFQMGRIRLGKDVTKTKTKRSFAMVENLRQWLAPFNDRKGKVFSSVKATDRVIAFAKEQGVEWPSNALRHSFCSYRSASTKSHPQVAMEAGNSVGMVKRHYDSVVSEEDAGAWFGITPEQPANVVSILKTANG